MPAPGFFYCSHASGVSRHSSIRFVSPRRSALLQPHQGIVHRSAEDGIHFLIVRHGFALPKSLWIA